MENVAEYKKNQDKYIKMKLTERSGRGICFNMKQTFYFCKELRKQKVKYIVLFKCFMKYCIGN